MRYIRPSYYDNFKCIADKCPDTCCAGWQIMIDEESLEKYGEVKGDFGKRLRSSIDWQEGAFYQNNKRCAFLNKENLCDLYIALGSDALCDTCRKYPRHVEEYEGLREWSLSLSCPVAAEIILSQQGYFEFIMEEDDEEDELEDEFEDFDLMLFTQLEDARAAVLKHLKNAEGVLEEKLSVYLQFAREMQDCISRGEYFEIDAVVRRYEEGNFTKLDAVKERQMRFCHRRALFQHMIGLERLRQEWSLVLEELDSTLYVEGDAHYIQCVERFEEYLQEHQEAKKQWEENGLQLFVFFLFTYFCGAVYDDWIYSKMALAVESVRFIRELCMAKWLVNGHLDQKDYVELAYRYAREIEHSDENLNALEELFMD